MKAVSIVGVRPQFIKLFSISRALREQHQEVIVHTGQHYDFEMSEIFLQELGLPKPDYQLLTGSGAHGAQTGRMLIELEQVLLKEAPDLVIVLGDTNSTLAGALAAAKLHIPLAHVEAGVRSYNRAMPEEINRLITDRIANILLCPTQSAIDNLAQEGIHTQVHWVGDVMYDTALFFSADEQKQAQVLAELDVAPKKYLLATIHRPINTDNREHLESILNVFSKFDETVIFPVHPRTQKALQHEQLAVSPNVHLIEPQGYLEMLALEKNARIILTDSGGVQKEAFFFGVPCITLREETEWPELVHAGWNKVTGVDQVKILDAVQHWYPETERPHFFGSGSAGKDIVRILEDYVQ